MLRPPAYDSTRETVHDRPREYFIIYLFARYIIDYIYL